MIVPTLPKGTQFARALLCIARAGAEGNPVAIASNSYGDGVVHIVRAIVDAGGIGSGQWGAVLATPAVQEWIAAVEQASIIGKLASLRRVPFRVRLQMMGSGFTGYWVGGGKAKPISKAAVTGDTLEPLIVAVVAVLTQPLVRSTSPLAEQRFRADMLRALSAALDSAFIDPSNAGIAGVMPASILNGATPLSSTGSPGADLALLIAAFDGDLESAAVITDPVTGAEIGLARDAAGGYLFPDAGPRGGSLLGLPLITSRSSPRDSGGGILALVDGSGIAYGSEGIRTASSEQTTIEMVDDTTSPPTSEQVSMYQTNSVALLSEIAANWLVARPGAVAYVADATYATEIA